MGTSQSSLGPNGESPLIPPWADDQPTLPIPKALPARFSGFRRSFGQFVQSGNRSDLNRALRNYATKSTGGGNTASRRLGSVSNAGAGLYSFLAGTGSITGENGEQFSLTDLTGQPCDSAIATISRVLTPNDGDADKIRSAINNSLVNALEGVDTFDPGAITNEVIITTMLNYLAESVFLQIALDAGKAWKKAESFTQQMNAERDLMQLTRVIVDEKLSSRLSGSSTKSFSRSQFLDIERQLIREVWADWEKYQ